MKISNLISNLSLKEPSIIGKDNYLNSAVLIPIMIIDGNEFILFQKRSQTVRQPGEVSFPGGHFDATVDSDSLSTAIRETCEELGIIRDKIKVLGKLGTLVAPMGVIVEAYLGILNINSIDELDIDSKEVEKIFLIPLQYFIDNKPEEYFTHIEIHPYTTNEEGQRVNHFPVKELGLPEQYSIPWKRGKHKVFVYKNSKEIIWGITAELIYDLSQRLKEKIDK